MNIGYFISITRRASFIARVIVRASSGGKVAELGVAELALCPPSAEKDEKGADGGRKHKKTFVASSASGQARS